VFDGVPDGQVGPTGEGDIWGSNPSQNMQLAVLCCHLANTNDELFRLLPNHFGACCRGRCRREVMKQQQQQQQQRESTNRRSDGTPPADSQLPLFTSARRTLQQPKHSSARKASKHAGLYFCPSNAMHRTHGRYSLSIALDNGQNVKSHKRPYVRLASVDKTVTLFVDRF